MLGTFWAVCASAEFPAGRGHLQEKIGLSFGITDEMVMVMDETCCSACQHRLQSHDFLYDEEER